MKPFSIRTSIEEWKTTVWSNIDVENMDMECKKFAKVTHRLFDQIHFPVRTFAALTRRCVPGTLIKVSTQR